MLCSLRLLRSVIGALAIFVTLSIATAQVHVTTTRISVTSTGAQASGVSWYASVSANGRYVAFESSAANLVPGDTNGQSDVFVRDRELGTTTRVSVSSAGIQGNGWSYESWMSADGQHVAFLSNATNLVVGDTNNKYDVFVRDLETGITTRASVSSAGVQGNDQSYDHPSISADGRYVAFRSFASNLVAGDTNGAYDVFLRDMLAGTTTRVSVKADGSQANGETSDPPSISADGRYVAFVSSAALTAGDTNGANDVFVRDAQEYTTTRVSISSGSTQGNSHSRLPSISADGRYVAFTSYASNLVAGDTNSTNDVFVRDLQAGTTTRISVSSANVQGNGSSSGPSISADGRSVAFESFAANFADGDTNGAPDVFVRDIERGTTTRVSVSTDGLQGSGYSNCASISADGRSVVYHSESTNLVPGDTNNARDVFLSQWTVVPRVSGNLILLDFVGQLPKSAVFEFRDPLSGSVVKAEDAAIGSGGQFALLSPGSGVWNLSVKVGHWLRQTLMVDTTNGDVSDVTFHLVNGDVDGDNAITVFDYTALSDAFDSVVGDANWDPGADLDGDDAVTVFDYAILSQSFDMVGDE